MKMERIIHKMERIITVRRQIADNYKRTFFMI